MLHVCRKLTYLQQGQNIYTIRLYYQCIPALYEVWNYNQSTNKVHATPLLNLTSAAVLALSHQPRALCFMLFVCKDEISSCLP